MNLYKIKERYALILNLLEESEGEITEEIKVLLDQHDVNINDLLESLCIDLNSENANLSVVKDELDRLKEVKTATENRIDRKKKDIINILHYFDLKSPNKKSRGYAFKTPLFSGFTTVRETIKFNEEALEEFNVDGKESKFVNYSLKGNVPKYVAKYMNKMEYLTPENIVPVIDKTAAKEYIKSITTNGATLEQGNLDPITGLVIYDTSESLTVK
jgi:hypothetical protein